MNEKFKKKLKEILIPGCVGLGLVLIIGGVEIYNARREEKVEQGRRQIVQAREDLALKNYNILLLAVPQIDKLVRDEDYKTAEQIENEAYDFVDWYTQLYADGREPKSLTPAHMSHLTKNLNENKVGTARDLKKDDFSRNLPKR